MLQDILRREPGHVWRNLKDGKLRLRKEKIWTDLVDGEADVMQRPLLLVAHHVRLILLRH